MIQALLLIMLVCSDYMENNRFGVRKLGWLLYSQGR